MVLYGTARATVTIRGRATDGAPSPGGGNMVEEVNYAEPSGAQRLKELLLRANMSQRGAARELEISERQMRYYCAGEQKVPKVVLLALERLVDLQRTVSD